MMICMRASIPGQAHGGIKRLQSGRSVTTQKLREVIPSERLELSRQNWPIPVKTNMEGEINMLLCLCNLLTGSIVSVLLVQVLFLNRYALLQKVCTVLGVLEL